MAPARCCGSERTHLDQFDVLRIDACQLILERLDPRRQIAVDETQRLDLTPVRVRSLDLLLEFPSIGVELEGRDSHLESVAVRHARCISSRVKRPMPLALTGQTR